MDYATHVYASHKVTRNADNTINMNGLLVLTDKAAANTGARMTGTPSAKIEVPEGIKGHKTISKQVKMLLRVIQQMLQLFREHLQILCGQSMQMHLHLIILWLMM